MCDVFHFKIFSERIESYPYDDELEFFLINLYSYYIETLSKYLYFVSFFRVFGAEGIFIQFCSFKKFYCTKLRVNNLRFFTYTHNFKFLLIPMGGNQKAFLQSLANSWFISYVTNASFYSFKTVHLFIKTNTIMYIFAIYSIAT